MTKLRDWLERYGESFKARQRARERLPSWAREATFLTVAVCLLGAVLALVAAAFALHDLAHPGIARAAVPRPAVGALLFAALLAALPLSLMAGNVVLWLVVPLRRAHEAAFKDAPAASFSDGMSQLLWVLLIMSPLIAVLAIVGVWDPWLS